MNQKILQIKRCLGQNFSISPTLIFFNEKTIAATTVEVTENGNGNASSGKNGINEEEAANAALNRGNQILAKINNSQDKITAINTAKTEPREFLATYDRYDEKKANEPWAKEALKMAVTALIDNGAELYNTKMYLWKHEEWATNLIYSYAQRRINTEPSILFYCMKEYGIKPSNSEIELAAKNFSIKSPRSFLEAVLEGHNNPVPGQLLTYIPKESVDIYVGNAFANLKYENPDEYYEITQKFVKKGIRFNVNDGYRHSTDSRD